MSVLMVRDTPELLRLEWFGDLTPETVSQGLFEVERLQRPQVWIDLLRVTGCSLQARSALLDVHRQLMASSERRVWIAASPKLRAVGTWIAHITDDENIRVVATEAQGTAWLESTDKRLEPAKRGIEAFMTWKAAQ